MSYTLRFTFRLQVLTVDKIYKIINLSEKRISNIFSYMEKLVSYRLKCNNDSK